MKFFTLLMALFVVTAALAQEPLFVGDRASFDPKTIDVNLPDGSPVKAGSKITKIWLIHNRGIVPWNGRELRLDGDAQGFKLTKAHSFSAPSATDVKVSVDLTVPNKPGHYRIYFKQWAKDDKGVWQKAFPNRYKDGVYLDVNVN